MTCQLHVGIDPLKLIDWLVEWAIESFDKSEERQWNKKKKPKGWCRKPN